MENLRKEHLKEVERIRSEHDSESKNIISLLQRQNVSLENKSEKLQGHIRNLETRIRELMNQVEEKNDQILKRDQAKTKMELEHQVASFLYEENTKACGWT
jgi:predicted nuclease with TOPRIM domain